MNTETQNQQNRQAAIRALAVVGFIALIFIGMTLAIYTARYIPSAVSGIGQAAVSLSSVFTPAKPSLEVVNTGTTLPFVTPAATTTATTTEVTTVDTTSTTTVNIPTTTTTVSTTHVATQPNPGASSESAYVIPGATGAGTTGTTGFSGTLYGQPDLAVSNITAGYLPLNNSTDADFVASPTVPAGTRFAVKFTVTNLGTNVSGNWDFSAQLPTSQSYTFFSPSQQSLNPGDKIDFMLHLDQGEARVGSNETASVTLDPDHNVSESNENNNFASVSANISQ